MKVIIIGGNNEYIKLFKSLGHEVVSSVSEAELACFTGGEDVTPALYGDAHHTLTYNSIDRDNHEIAIFESLMHKGVPMVGICRGAQFLNVMSGGRMLQHCEGHTRSHAITDLITGETVYVSSTHHQIMNPSPEAVMVAVSHKEVACEWFDGPVAKREALDDTAEVVFYRNTKCLCTQFHPEFNYPEYDQMREYFKSLLSRYLGAE